MNTDFYYLLTLTEIIGLLLLIVFVFNLILRKDKVNLIAYVVILKDKIKALKLKLAEQTNQPELVKQLLLETIEYIKESYLEKYQHELGTPPPETDPDEQARTNNTKEHFIYVLGYQSLKAELSALENSNNPQSTWEKIEASLSALVNNFRIIIPENFHQAPDDSEPAPTAQEIQQEDRIKKLLEETIEHIKEVYVEKFGHAIGEGGTSTEEDNSKEHFLHILGYQSLRAQLTAFDNSNTGEKTWDKISAQLSSLIENFRIMPEKEFETIIEERIQEYIITKESKERTGQLTASETSQNSDKKKSYASNSNSPEQDQFLLERKNEIDRLKGQVSSQFEDIWKLQDELSRKLAAAGSGDNSNNEEISKNMETITRQLKDSELCISMMDADIAAQEEEIQNLKRQLDESPQSNNAFQSSDSLSNSLKEEIKQKDDMIASFSRDSKEMLSLIDGMEKNDDEKSQRIQDMQIIEAQLRESLSQQTATQQSSSSQDDPSEELGITKENQQQLDRSKQIIERFAQESKEMLTVIDGLEMDNDKQKEQIKDLQAQIELKIEEAPLAEEKPKVSTPKVSTKTKPRTKAKPKPKPKTKPKTKAKPKSEPPAKTADEPKS